MVADRKNSVPEVKLKQLNERNGELRVHLRDGLRACMDVFVSWGVPCFEAAPTRAVQRARHQGLKSISRMPPLIHFRIVKTIFSSTLVFEQPENLSYHYQY